MRVYTFLILLGAGCTGSDSDPDSLDLCAVEDALVTEQAALGLATVRVCNDLKDLGDTTLIEAGVVSASADFGAVLSESALTHRAEFEGTRRLFSYDGITVSVPSAEVTDVELAILTAQAWSTWKVGSPSSFGVIAEMSTEPTEATLACCSWRNRLDHVVVSLDASPLEIGASVTLVGDPIAENGEQVYPNTGLISLDRETITGGDSTRGSRPIYNATDDRENELRYFADGAVFTLAHEASHLYIDHRNSVSPLANRVWDGRNFANASYVSAEEVIANLTACEALPGVLSAEMLAFNQDITMTLRSYDGVEDRLTDLSSYDSVGAERLKLMGTTGCGG
ncbi:MAG: hypothetical protein AB8H79_24885 [Myxococcota bacterium]